MSLKADGKLELSDWIALAALVISMLSLWWSWDTANAESYRTKIDARITHCATVASVYADQSWAYRSETGRPDRDLETYSEKAMAIGRAAQLCRNSSDTVSILRNCVATLVDGPVEHKVTETGFDGKSYSNLVC